MKLLTESGHAKKGASVSELQSKVQLSGSLWQTLEPAENVQSRRHLAPVPLLRALAHSHHVGLRLRCKKGVAANAVDSGDLHQRAGDHPIAQVQVLQTRKLDVFPSIQTGCEPDFLLLSSGNFLSDLGE